MSASQRRKGANGEREVCRLLADELGVDVSRQLNQPRDGGCDIRIGRTVIEVKRREVVSLPAAWRQVNAACRDGDIPCVLYRASRQPWRALLPWNWFQEHPDLTYENAILATLPAFAAMVRETL